MVPRPGGAVESKDEETSFRLKAMAACMMRVADLYGARQIETHHAVMRNEAESSIRQCEFHLNRVRFLLKLDGREFSALEEMLTGEIPLWTKDARRVRGFRVTARDHFEAHWRAMADTGIVRSRDLLRRDPGLYGALTMHQRRRRQSIRELFRAEQMLDRPSAD